MAATLLSRDENTVLIFAERIMSEFLNNAALISSHVDCMLSHASFFVQLQMFLKGFTSADCKGHSIVCLSVFPNHVNTAMAMWQRALSYWNTNGCCWSLNICSTGSSKFSSMRWIRECRLRFYSKTTKLPATWMLMHPQTIAVTCLRSRNRIASRFILYAFSSNILHVHLQSEK